MAMALNPMPAVLVVEDDDDDVFFLRRAFRQAGITHAFHRVRDGEEGRHYLLGHPPFDDRHLHPFPCLVLLDLKLPRRDGFELLESVRAEPALRRLPLIVLSSSKESVDVNRAYAAGANCYLVKPLRFEDLLELMRKFRAFWLESAHLPGGFPVSNGGKTPEPAAGAERDGG